MQEFLHSGRGGRSLRELKVYTSDKIVSDDQFDTDLTLNLTEAFIAPHLRHLRVQAKIRLHLPDDSVKFEVVNKLANIEIRNNLGFTSQEESILRSSGFEVWHDYGHVAIMARSEEPPVEGKPALMVWPECFLYPPDYKPSLWIDPPEKQQANLWKYIRAIR